jgi:hypothetical protein
MIATTTAAPVEPSAWLRQRIADRVARVRSLGLDPDRRDPLIVAPLGRTGGRHERTCDRCQTYTPVGPMFWTRAIPAAAGLVLIAGMCTPCARREGWCK